MLRVVGVWWYSKLLLYGRTHRWIRRVIREFTTSVRYIAFQMSEFDRSRVLRFAIVHPRMMI
jgi:hypothetical protein